MVRHTGNERRTVVKHIGVIDRALFDRFFKCLIVAPVANEVFFVLVRAPAGVGLEFHMVSLIIVKQKTLLLPLEPCYRWYHLASKEVLLSLLVRFIAGITSGSTQLSFSSRDSRVIAAQTSFLF